MVLMSFALKKEKGVVRLQSKTTQMKESSEQCAPLCISCKSFFGNQATAGMCSKCYKSHGAQSQLKAPNTAPAPLVSTPTKDKKENKENSECGVKVEEGSKVEVQAPKKEPVNKDACSKCNRKLRLLGVECRCGLFFCNSHRLPEDHSCSFNHKELGKERLTKQVVKVQNGKIENI